MSRITKYNDFLEDNHLQILLEANIVFEPKFKNLLNQINSPIVDKIIKLEGEDIDVNTNHISFNTDKENIVTFLPDSKTKNAKTYYNSGGGYTHWGATLNLATENQELLKNEDSTPRKVKVPSNNTEITIVKYAIPLDYIHKNFGMMSNSFDEAYSSGNTISLVSWEGDDTYYVLLDTNCITYDLGDIKRSDINVGRFTRALLTKAGETVNNKELEDFVNKYKAAVLIEKEAFTRFDIVEGDDLRDFYNLNTYESKSMGSLGSSCMRYTYCASYLDIYVKNPDEVKLIILRSRNNNDLITGRALLWYTDQGIKFMDRVYVNNYADVTLFIEYAIKNEFHYKKNQNFEEGEPIMFDGKELTLRDSEITVTLSDGGEFDYYPYLDTLKYYNPDNDTLSNDTSYDYKYELNDTDGGNGRCEECDGSGYFTCDSCSGGRYECPECEGSGNAPCDECDGSGEIMCDRCDDGRVDCSNGCTNGSVDCGDCDGRGEDEDGEECSTCNGSGELECMDCNGSGTEECSKCDGSSYVSCRNCDGDGRIDCAVCDGDGDLSCNDCDGDGRINCDSCN